MPDTTNANTAPDQVAEHCPICHLAHQRFRYSARTVCTDALLAEVQRLTAERDAAVQQSGLDRREVVKWREWQPDNDELRDLQEQARARDGSYTNGLAAQCVYIGGLEAEVRRLQSERDAAHAAGFRAGAVAALGEARLRLCRRCADGQELIDGRWHRQGTEMVTSCGFIDLIDIAPGTLPGAPGAARGDVVADVGLTLDQILEDLYEIHTEFVDGDKSDDELAADLRRAWDAGHADPCGCSICQLVQRITIAQIKATPARVGAVAAEG